MELSKYLTFLHNRVKFKVPEKEMNGCLVGILMLLWERDCLSFEL